MKAPETKALGFSFPQLKDVPYLDVTIDGEDHAILIYNRHEAASHFYHSFRPPRPTRVSARAGAGLRGHEPALATLAQPHLGL